MNQPATNILLGGFRDDLLDGELARYPRTHPWNRSDGAFRRRGTPHKAGKSTRDTCASAWCSVWRWEGKLWEVMYGHLRPSWIFAPHLIPSNSTFLFRHGWVLQFWASWEIVIHAMWLRLIILGFVHGCLDNMISLIGVPCSSYVGINAGTSGRDFLNPMGLPWVPSVVSSNLVTGRILCCNI